LALALRAGVGCGVVKIEVYRHRRTMQRDQEINI
jgi:hypothetical protein